MRLLRRFPPLPALFLLATVGCGAQERAAPVEADDSPTTTATTGSSGQSAQAIGPSLASQIDAERLQRAIHAAAGYLIRSCDDAGQFTYRVNLDPTVEVEPSYNMIRHAGAMYALDVYNRWHPDRLARRTIRRAGGYLKRHTFATVPGAEAMSGLWTLRAEGETDVAPIVRLGAAGLGLAAFAGVYRVAPGDFSIEELHGLGRFLLFMQKSDGTFFSAYDPVDKGRCDKWPCEYYPGESLLGLIMLYKADPNPTWRDAAANGLSALAVAQRDNPLPPPDHWAMLATAELMSMIDARSTRFPCALWRHHAAGICRGILVQRAAGRPMRAGDLSGNGQLCHIATRLEAILAVAAFVHADQWSPDLSTATADAVNLLMDAQVHGGPCDGAFTRLAFPSKSGSTGRSDPRDTEVRIDYVQHSLNAMIRCAELTGARAD